MGDVRDLVSAPKEARGLGANDLTVVGALTTTEFRVAAPGDILIESIWLHSSEPTLRWGVRIYAAAPGPNVINVGRFPCQGGMAVTQPAPALGAGIGQGDVILDGLRWHIAGGFSLAVSHSANANVPYDVTANVVWKELPAPSIEP
jgi:hypothetical protein